MKKYLLILAVLSSLNLVAQIEIKPKSGGFISMHPFGEGYLGIAHFTAVVYQTKKRKLLYYDKNGNFQWYKQVEPYNFTTQAFVNANSEFGYLVCFSAEHGALFEKRSGNYFLIVHQVNKSGKVKQKKLSYGKYFSDFLGKKKGSARVEYMTATEDGLVFMVSKNAKDEDGKFDEFYMVKMNHNFEIKHHKLDFDLVDKDWYKKRSISRPKFARDGNQLCVVQLENKDENVTIKVQHVGLDSLEVSEVVRHKIRFDSFYPRSSKYRPINEIESKDYVQHTMTTASEKVIFTLGTLMDYQLRDGKLYGIGSYTKEKASNSNILAMDGIYWFEIPLNDNATIQGDAIKIKELTKPALATGVRSINCNIDNGVLNYVVNYSGTTSSYSSFSNLPETKVRNGMTDEYCLLYSKHPNARSSAEKIRKNKKVTVYRTDNGLFICEKARVINTIGTAKRYLIIDNTNDRN